MLEWVKTFLMTRREACASLWCQSSKLVPALEEKAESVSMIEEDGMKKIKRMYL